MKQPTKKDLIASIKVEHEKDLKEKLLKWKIVKEAQNGMPSKVRNAVDRLHYYPLFGTIGSLRMEAGSLKEAVRLAEWFEGKTTRQVLVKDGCVTVVADAYAHSDEKRYTLETCHSYSDMGHVVLETQGSQYSAGKGALQLHYNIPTGVLKVEIEFSNCPFSVHMQKIQQTRGAEYIPPRTIAEDPKGAACKFQWASGGDYAGVRKIGVRGATSVSQSLTMFGDT